LLQRIDPPVDTVLAPVDLATARLDEMLVVLKAPPGVAPRDAIGNGLAAESLLTAPDAVALVRAR